MNNNRSFNSSIKFLTFSLVLLTTLFTFMSCENFLQGEDVKDEIARTIEYNNAPSFTINVEALKGSGDIKTPATGEVVKKVTDTFPIRFDPSDDHKFIKWEAKFASNQSAADYVSFENAESLETTVTFKKEPPSVIIIQPVCPPRLTYTFDLYDPDDPTKKYPKDSSITFNFNKTISSGSLAEAGIIPDASNYIAIQNIQPSEGSSATYFKTPEINDRKIIIRSDSSFGYIPVYNGQRMISVTIDKDKVWYVNEDYLSPVRVYLDSNITRTFYIGEETSAKTTIRYAVKQKEEKPIGTLKVTVDNITEEADDKPHEYSVGKEISLRYQLPEGYAFNQWKFLNSKGKEFDEDDLKFTVSEPEGEGTERLILLDIIIDNSMEEEVTIVPEIYDPRIIEFTKPEENSGIFKVDNSTFAQEKQTNKYAVGKDFVFSYKLAEGYYFHDWAFKRIYKDENGNQKSEAIIKEKLNNYGLNLSYEEDADEKGYDSTTRIAQAKISINNYSDDIISITPICFEHLKVTNFNLNDTEKYYNRDSSIELTFNKPLPAECIDAVTIKIPGLAEDKTFSNYFENIVVNQNKLTISANGDGIDKLLPLGADGSNTISILANSDELYYKALTPGNEIVNVGLASNLSYTYKINSSTTKKTKLKFQTDSSIPFGTLKVNGTAFESKPVEYSIGDKIDLTFTIANSERREVSFNKWKVLYTYTDEAGENQESVISDYEEDINLRFSPEIISDTSDVVVYGASVTILNSKTGLITIQPEIKRIPKVEININGGEHGLSTVSGETIYRLGELNHLDYKTDSAYAFIPWQLIDSSNNKEIEKKEGTDDYLYIQSSNLNSEKMDFTITDIPADDIKLELRPIVAERPQIISNLPLPGSAVRKDTTIQVRFDYDMDEYSIYYTDEEVDSLIDKLNLTYDDDNECYVRKDKDDNVIATLLYDYNMGMYYGYKNEDEVVYKNITIINSNNSENIIDCFDPPVFENPRTLTIGVHRESDKSVKIQKYSQILVTINENMFYWQEGKNVTMAQSKKWIYQVSNATDETGPHYTDGNEPVLKIDENAISRVSNSSLPNGNISEENITSSGITIGDKTIKYLKSTNSNLKFEISDTEDDKDGAGVASTFIMKFQQLYDDHYNYVPNGAVRSIGISSNSVGQVAEFDGNLSYIYSLLNSGIYSVDLIFRDVCGNETTYDADNKWLICVDKTAPKFDKSIVTWENDELNKLKLKLDKNASSYYKDIKQIEVRQRYLSNSLGDWETLVQKTDSQGNVYWELDNLLPGYNYTIVPRSYDALNNSSGLIAITHGYTKPVTPKTVSFSSGNGTKPTITAVKPDAGACENIRIRYREQGNTTWSTYPSSIAASSTGSSVTMSAGLTYGKIYEFEICSVANSVYSEPYKLSNGSYPTYTTNPAVPTLGSVNYNNAEKSLTVTYTRPNVGDFDGIKIIYSTKSDFTNASTKTISKSLANGSYKIESLADGTKYYVKVEAWSKVESNKSTSSVKSAYTMPGKVNNLWSDEWGTNWMSIDLTYKPAGEYNGYNIYYKLSSESSYKKANSSLVPKIRDYYYIGEYEDGNVVTPGRSYDIKVETVLNDTENNITLTNNAVAPNFTKTLPPETVTNLTSKKLSDTSMRLTWSTPTGYFDGYNIRYSTSDNYSNATRYNTSGISKTTTSYDLTGLTSKGYYYVWVEPYVGAFNDSNREYTTSKIRCSLALDPVSNVTATAISPNEIKLAWANIESTAYDGLEIYRKKSTENESAYVKIATPAKTATSYSNTGLDPNILYNYKIVTYKGTGGARLTCETTINRRTLSASVSNFTAAVQSHSEVKLTWSNPISTNYYQIKIYNGSSLVTTLSKGTTSYNVTGLTGATSYTFYVKTTNDTGTLSNSYPSGITTRTKPVPVTNVKTNSRNSTSVTITWTAPASGNYTGFWAHYKPSSSTSWTTLGYYNSSTTSCTITGLSAGTKYDFEVQSYFRDSDNNYFWSTYTSIETSTSAALLPNFTVSGQYTNSLYLTWTNLNSANYDYVRIWYKKASASSWSTVDITKGNSGYTLSADPGCRYQVQAIAYFNGYGTYTDVILTQTYPTTPTNFKVTSTEGIVTVSWTPPSGEQSYRLGYKKSGGSWSYVNIGAGNSSYSFGTNISNSSEYSFYMWSKMDNVDYGNTLTSNNTSTLTYFTPPPRLPGVNVGATTSKWILTVENWDSVKSMIPYVNVFVDGDYVGGFNSSTGKVELYGDYENKTITLVPYHKKNAGHGYEVLSTEQIYNGGSYFYKTLQVWDNETYGKRFSIYRLDVNNYR